jgi:2-keto-3-deoxy-L-rhamnonate aldolase RhmA
MTESVKETLAGGGVAVGTLVMEFDTVGIARIAAGAGARFVLYDPEHTGWGIDRVRTLVSSARATTAEPFVRIPALGYHLVSQPLDAGAKGLMLPAIASADDARAFVDAAKFPPVGTRRFGIVYSDALEPDLEATMRRYDREILLIGQIETAEGVANVDDIAAVVGLDILWVGSYDLSISLGCTGRFDDPAYVRAVDRVLAACDAEERLPGFWWNRPKSGWSL